jgi:hypothetical protein
MSVERILDSQPQDVLVETVYLAGRLLSRPLTWELFLRQLESDIKTETRPRSLKLVRQIVDSIEREQGKSLSEISSERKLQYVSELDALLWKSVGIEEEDGIEIDALLESLRKISA